MSEKPFSVIVEAEIKEDRMEEFLAMIEKNAIKSRQEPGCIRFGALLLEEWTEKYRIISHAYELVCNSHFSTLTF